jgi:hypothetical protein
MSYRVTPRQKARLAAMRAAKERLRKAKTRTRIERIGLVELMIQDVADTPMSSAIACCVLGYLRSLGPAHINKRSVTDIGDAIGRSPKWCGRVLRILERKGLVGSSAYLVGRRTLAFVWYLTDRGDDWLMRDRHWFWHKQEMYRMFDVKVTH